MRKLTLLLCAALVTGGLAVLKSLGSDSPPKLSSRHVAGGLVEIGWAATGASRYTLESSSDLAVWTESDNEVQKAANGSSFVSFSPGRYRFFRLRQLPFLDDCFVALDTLRIGPTPGPADPPEEVRKCFSVTTLTPVTLEKDFREVVLFNIGFLVWPGMICSAKSLAQGQPVELVLPRQPLEGGVSGLGLTDGSFTVSDPWSVSVYDKINSILRANEPTVWPDVLATWSAIESVTLQQTLIDLGVGTGSADVFLNAGFRQTNAVGEHAFTFRATQAYFKAVARPKSSPVDYFRGLVSCSALTKQLEAGDAPVIVTEVTYGRAVYLQAKTTSHSETTTATMRSAFESYFNGRADAEQQKLVQNSSLSAILVGGNPDAITLMSDPDDIKLWLESGRRFSSAAPGFPLSFKASYLDGRRTPFEYGETTSFVMSETKLLAGDGAWQFWALGGNDRGHNNDYFLPLDLQGFCPDPAPPGHGGCWGAPIGLRGGGTGNLDVPLQQDCHSAARTFLWTPVDTSITLSLTNEGPTWMYLDGLDVTAPNPKLFLRGGKTHELSVVGYHQHANGWVRVDFGDIAESGVIVDSTGCR